MFRAGKVVAAYRTNASATVGEGLLEAGVVPPTTYQEMLAAQKSGKRAPDLFGAFQLDREALQGALEGLLKQVIYAMFEWNEGTFSFVLEDTPDIWRGFALESSRAVAENGLNPQFLAIEGARLRDEREKEDTLSSFLMKAQPAPAVQRPSTLNVQEIAAKLRTAAELDARPETGTPAPPHAPSPESARAPAATRQAAPVPAHAPSPPEPEKVIPFPAERVRGRPGAPPPQAAARPVAAHGAFRLLAVDDDPQVTRLIKADLEGRFAAITTVDTVQDALAEIEAGPENLVVASDLIIARSDGRGILGGIEILERVRQRWTELPVVLFTDYQNEEAEARARSMGVLAVLPKPRKAQVQGGQDAGGVVHDFLKALGVVLTPFFDGREPAGTGRVASARAPVAPAAAQPSPEGDAAARVSVGGFDLRREMVQEMDELGRSLEAELPPPLISAGEMAVLRSMLAELIDPANRDTVTLLVLRFASHLVERAGLFLATRRAYVGLGGFSVDEPSDRFVGRVRRIQIRTEAESVFGAVSRFRSMIRAPLKKSEGNHALIEGLGGEWPAGETVAAPLISGDRVAAILYGDNPSGKPLGATDSLEIFLQQAGLAMDRALLERKLEDSRRHRDDSE